MKSFATVQWLSVAAALVVLAGCSGGSAVAPKPIAPSGGSLSGLKSHPFASFDACPATGQIVYVSDAKNNVVNIYTRTFHGQGPCGQIASGLLNDPQEISVNANAHDLYVANFGGKDVLVFHRGQVDPYNSYTDPSGQLPEDVAVAKDGTVIASNQTTSDFSLAGSLSTWIGGPNGGTFVGNFPMTKDLEGFSVAIDHNGVVFLTDEQQGSGAGALWQVLCPAGACGVQTRPFPDADTLFTFILPGNLAGGMQFDASGDLLVVDETGSRLCTFALPNPKPSMFPLAGGDPRGMAIDKADNHLFITELINNYAAEYSYPGGVFIGSVPNNAFGDPEGIAIDP